MWQLFVEFLTFEMISWNSYHHNSVKTTNSFIFSRFQKNLVQGILNKRYFKLHQTTECNKC